jgi:hypothetical protein
VDDLSPQLVESLVRTEVGMDEGRPARGWARDRRPVDLRTPEVLERLAAAGRDVAADAIGVGAVEQAGGDRTGEADVRAAFLAELAHHLDDPAGLVAQGVVDRLVEPGALHPRVGIAHVDEHRAGPVGAGGDRAGEPLLPDRGAHMHALSRLDVRTEVDDQVGHAFQGAAVHGATLPQAAILPIHAD